MRRRFRVLVALVAIASGLPAAGARGQKVEDAQGVLRTSDRPEGRPIAVLRRDGVDYVDLQDVALVTRATKYWRAELGKMVLKVGERRVTLTVGSPYVYADQAGTNLLAPVLWHRGRILVPVRLVTHVLNPLIPERVEWIPASRELRVVRGAANLAGLAWDLRGGATVVALRITEPLAGELARQGGRAVVTVPGARLADTVPAHSRGIGLVDSVDVTEDPAGATFTFHVAEGAGSVELVARPVPPRLELVVTPPAVEGEIPDAEFQPAVPVLAPRPVRRVVLDPGHGGSDEGAKAGSGLAEKEVALAVARRLRDLAAADGFEVVLTRDRDVFVSSEDRARAANAPPADVFVSLHANAWFDPDLEGFGVGVSSASPAPAQDGLTPVRWGTKDEMAVHGAEVLAEILIRQLAGGTGRESRGVRAAPWVPLEGAGTAAVMVECGFLTNEGDAKRLADPAFLDKVAKSIAAALREYRGAVQAQADSLAAGYGGPGADSTEAP